MRVKSLGEWEVGRRYEKCDRGLAVVSPSRRSWERNELFLSYILSSPRQCLSFLRWNVAMPSFLPIFFLVSLSDLPKQNNGQE